MYPGHNNNVSGGRNSHYEYNKQYISMLKTNKKNIYKVIYNIYKVSLALFQAAARCNFKIWA
jgi:hypothetical protein